MEQIGVGLKRGAELAGVEIPGGEVAILPELIRGHPSPNGFDLTATCFGTVALDADRHGRDDRARRRADRTPEQRAALEFVHARAAGARRRSRRAVRGRHRGRRAARADGHLRARRARPAPLGRPRPRPRAHHRRRAPEPAAAQRPRPASRSTTRCPSRRSSRSCRSAARSPRPRPGRSSTWAAASSPIVPAASADAAVERARRPSSGHAPDRHRHRRGRARRPCPGRYSSGQGSRESS